MLCSCAEKKKSGNHQNEQPKQETALPKQATSENTPSADPDQDEETKTKSGFSLLAQLHKDTILRRVRLPRYDQDFNPLSLLSAEEMEVIDGQTIEAHDVSMEMYEADGRVKARTKMRRAIYEEQTATLRASEAIYIQGSGFQASGSGLVYDTLSGRGFIVGPASTLFHIEQSQPTDTNQ